MPKKKAKRPIAKKDEFKLKVQTIKRKYPLDRLAPDGRIGVLSLATDFVIEDDLSQMLPSTVTFFTSRVLNYQPLTFENLRKMAPRIKAAAESILPGDDGGVDVYMYACTSGSIAIGEDKVTEYVREARPGAMVTNPATAALEAFKALNAKKVTMITPYLVDVNTEFAAYFQSRGIEVLNVATFDFGMDIPMSFISPDDIKQAAIEFRHPDAELVFISCTSLRAVPVIAEIEKALGIPVVSSSQSLAWHALKLINYCKPVHGFGALMENCLEPARQSENIGI